MVPVLPIATIGVVSDAVPPSYSRAERSPAARGTKPLFITGIGMASSLGIDAFHACAAARAGIVRPQPLVNRVAFDPESGAMEPIIGHPVAALTKGFVGAARLARLGALALEDLLSRAELSSGDLATTAVVLALGSGYYTNAAEMIEDGQPFTVTPPPEIEQTTAWKARARAIVTQSMFEAVDIPAPARVELLFDDQAGLGLALQRAAALLAEPGIQRCIVGGVDSYCDPDVLEVLTQLQLLHSPTNPVGIVPGEAAALLLLATRPAGVDGPIASISPPAYLADGAHQLSPDVHACMRLARVVEQTLAMDEGPSCRVSVGTHSGALWTAAEWGRARAAVPQWDTNHWLPALSFGETGAAAAALGTCLAVRALARGYSEGKSLLVWASSPGGMKTAYIVAQT